MVRSLLHPGHVIIPRNSDDALSIRRPDGTAILFVLVIALGERGVTRAVERREPDIGRAVGSRGIRDRGAIRRPRNMISTDLEIWRRSILRTTDLTVGEL